MNLYMVLDMLASTIKVTVAKAIVALFVVVLFSPLKCH